MRRKQTHHPPLRNGSHPYFPILPVLARGSRIFADPVWTEIGRGLRLSRRELQIVRRIFDDRTESVMANELGISRHTVHTHMERLRRKLSATDRATIILHVVEEFLLLTAAPGSGLPPVCGWRAAGLCRLRD